MQKKVLMPALMAVSAVIPSAAGVDSGTPQSGTMSPLEPTSDEKTMQQGPRSAALVASVVNAGDENGRLEDDKSVYHYVNVVLQGRLEAAKLNLYDALENAEVVKGYTINTDSFKQKADEVFERGLTFMIPGTNVGGAYDYNEAHGCVAGMTAAINELDAQTADFKTKLGEQNTLMNAAVALLNDYQQKLAAAKANPNYSQVTAYKDAADLLGRYINEFGDFIRGQYSDLVLDTADESYSQLTAALANQSQLIADLGEAFDTAASIMADHAADLASFRALIDAEDATTYPFLDVVKKDGETAYGNLNATYNGLLQNYTDLKTIGVDNALEQIISFNERETQGSLSKDIEDQKALFAKNVAEAFRAEATTRYADVESQVNTAITADVTHAATLTAELETVKTKLDGIDIAAAGSDLDQLASCKTTAIEIFESLVTITGKLDAYKANQAAHDEITGQYEGIKNLLDGAEEDNERSLVPADALFADRIAAVAAKFDTFKEDVKGSLEANEMVAKKESYQKTVNDLTTELTGLTKDINANNDNYNTLIGKEKETQNLIKAIRDKIDDNKSISDLNVVKDWNETLKKLLNEDVHNADVEIYDAYGKGELANEDKVNEIIKKFTDIQEATQEIIDAFDAENGEGSLAQAVKDCNKEISEKWDVLVAECVELYKQATAEYDNVRRNATNRGWKAEIEETLKGKTVLYGYFKEITDLDTDFYAYVEECNLGTNPEEQRHAISETELQDWCAKENGLDALREKLVNAKATFINDCEQKATDYYDSKDLQVGEAISQAQQTLLKVGIEDADTYLKQATDLRSEAGGMLTAGNNRTLISLVADKLEAAAAAINLNEAAKQAWKKEFDEAEKTVKGYLTEVEGFTMAVETVVNEWKSYLEGYLNHDLPDASAQAAEAGNNGDLIDNYARLSGYLDKIRENAKQARDMIEGNHNFHKTENEAYNDFVTTVKPQLEGKLEALKDYVVSLGVLDMLEDVNSLENQIANLVYEIEVIHNWSSFNDNKEDYQSRWETIFSGFEDGYAAAAQVEMDYLDDRLKDTKDAFNDAYQKENGKLEPKDHGEKYDKLHLEVEGLRNTNEDLKLKYDGKLTAENRDAFKTEALELETAISKLYVQLMATVGENPATAAANDLNARHDALLGEITAAETALAGYLEELSGYLDATEFTSEYSGLKTVLAAEKEAWTAEGDHIVDRMNVHTMKLNEVATAAGALGERVEAAQNEARALKVRTETNNENYTRLRAEYDALVARRDAALALFESYKAEDPEWAGFDPTWLAEEYIGGFLNDALTALEKENMDLNLTAASNLEEKETIEQLETSLESMISHNYALRCIDVAREKGEAASNLLASNIIPAERKKGLEKWAEACAELGTADEKLAASEPYTEPDITVSKEVIAEAKAVGAKFDAIMEEASNHVFTPGDVNQDGEADVLDVQALITMVGETGPDTDLYAELYSASPARACAADVVANERINIADVTSLIQMILGDDVQVVRVRARSNPAVTDGSLSLVPVDESEGVRRYALRLEGGVTFRGAQFDIRTSGNARVADVTTGALAEGHDANLFSHADGNSRVVIASMDNAGFADTRGIVAYIDVEGNGDITVENGIFADTNNVEHLLDRAHSSMIDAIIDSCKDGVKRIHDVTGRTFNRLQRGVNIILHKDGSVTKELRK